MWKEERDGKWRYFERYEDPVTGKIKRVSVTFDKKPTDTKAVKALDEKIRKKKGEMQSQTIEEVVKLYLKAEAYSCRKSTVERNEDALNSVIDIIGKDCIMNRLTANYIYEKMVQSGKKARTLNNYLIRFRAFIRWAHRKDYIDSTVCIDKLENFQDTPVRKRIQDKYLESKELKTLLDNMQDEGNKLITEFLTLSGMRIGELAALDNKDIGGDVIHITKTYNPVSVETTPGKTYNSERDIHIQPELADCIKRIQKFMKIRKIINR